MIKNIKRIFICLIVLVVAAQTVLFASADGTSSAAKNIIDDRFISDTGKAMNAGFLPDKLIFSDMSLPITRANACTVAHKLFLKMGGADVTVTSLSSNNDDILKLSALGIVEGVRENTFNGNQNISRAELCRYYAMVASRAGQNINLSASEMQSALSVYKDEVLGANMPYVAYMTKKGFISEINGEFKQNETISCVEALAVAAKMNDAFGDKSANSNTKAPMITNISDNDVINSDEIKVTWQYSGDLTDFTVIIMGKINKSVSKTDTAVFKKSELSNGENYVFVKAGDYCSGPVRFYMGQSASGNTGDEASNDTSDDAAFNGDIGIKFIKNGKTVPHDSRAGYLYGSNYRQTSFTVTWKKVNNAVKYKLKMDKERYGYLNRLPDIKTFDKNFKKDEFSYKFPYSIEPYKEYSFTVIAYNASGKEIKRSKATLMTSSFFDYGEKNDMVYINGAKTRADLKKLLKSVTVNVWKIKDGKKVTSTATFTVAGGLAENVKKIFKEIYEGAEKFPIKDVGGYRESNGEHGMGTALDINSNENYCIYSNGSKVGSFYKPNDSVYSIPPDGDLVKAFEKYGWIWGADAWSGNIDYMHFSFFGT